MLVLVYQKQNITIDVHLDISRASVLRLSNGYAAKRKEDSIFDFIQRIFIL